MMLQEASVHPILDEESSKLTRLTKNLQQVSWIEPAYCPRTPVRCSY